MPHKLFWVSTRISSHTHTHGKHKYLKHTARGGKALSQMNNTLSSRVAETNCTFKETFQVIASPQCHLRIGWQTGTLTLPSLRYRH